MTSPPYVSQSTFRTIYLGTPGSMVSARVPDTGLQYPLTRSGSSSQLLSGGTSVSRRPRTRRVHTYSWSNRVVDELNDILGFYSGLRGEGPFCLVDPSWRNMLGQAVGSFGRQLKAVSGWTPTASARPVTYDTTVAPPVGIAGGNSGVARWAPANGDELLEATSYNPTGTLVVPDIDSITEAGTAVPWLPNQTHTLSMAVKAVSGSNTARLVAYGINDSGVLGSLPAVLGTNTAITTAWQFLSVSVPVNQFPAGTEYVIASLRCGATGAPLQLANVQHEIGVSARSGWAVPLGVPRVVILDDNPAGGDVFDRQTQSLKLAEI